MIVKRPIQPIQKSPQTYEDFDNMEVNSRSTVVEILKDKPLTSNEIAKKLDFPLIFTRNKLNSLKRSGIVECKRIGQIGFWGITKKYRKEK